MLQEILIRHICDESIHSLNSQSITSLLNTIIKRFKKIDLDFTSDVLSKQEVIDLIGAIVDINQKINIKLNFNGMGIDDDIVITIAQLIGSNMRGNLELNLSNNDITDEGFYHIMRNFGYALSSTTIIVSNNKGIHDIDCALYYAIQRTKAPLNLILDNNKLASLMQTSRGLLETSMPAIKLSFVNAQTEDQFYSIVNAIFKVSTHLEIDFSGSNVNIADLMLPIYDKTNKRIDLRLGDVEYEEYYGYGRFWETIKKEYVNVLLTPPTNTHIECNDLNLGISKSQSLSNINLYFNTNNLNQGWIKAMQKQYPDSLVLYALKSPKNFLEFLSNIINFPYNLPIIGFEQNEMISKWLNTDVASVLYEFLDKRDLTLTNLQVIQKEGACMDNKYYAVDYQALGMEIYSKSSNSGYFLSTLEYINTYFAKKLQDYFVLSKKYAMHQLAQKHNYNLDVSHKNTKNIYLELAKQMHPDTVSGSTQAFQELNSIYHKNTNSYIEFNKLFGDIISTTTVVKEIANLGIKLHDISCKENYNIEDFLDLGSHGSLLYGIWFRDIKFISLSIITNLGGYLYNKEYTSIIKDVTITSMTLLAWTWLAFYAPTISAVASIVSLVYSACTFDYKLPDQCWWSATNHQLSLQRNKKLHDNNKMQMVFELEKNHWYNENYNKSTNDSAYFNETQNIDNTTVKDLDGAINESLSNNGY